MEAISLLGGRGFRGLGFRGLGRVWVVQSLRLEFLGGGCTVMYCCRALGFGTSLW